MPRPTIHAGAAVGKPRRGPKIGVTLLADCIARLAAGVSVVTANNRLARHIRAGYAQTQDRQGRLSWPTPDVLPWGAWLARLWEGAAWTADGPLPALLSDTLEQQVWQAAVAADRGRELLDVRAAAREACEARRRMRGWHMPGRELQLHGNEDCRAFLRWQARFEERCTREDWIDAARLPDELSGRLATIAPPERLALAGFDELSPQQRTFLEALEKRGAHVDLIPFGERPGAARRVALPEWRDELETAARWARRLIAADPQQRIGVVLPDLAGRREDVQRIFAAVLAPDAGPEHRLPFAISAAARLSDYPLVLAAFFVLRLAGRALGYDELGQLLRSPYLAGAETEATRRALLDAWLRKHGRLEISVEAARRAASAADRPHACPRLSVSLEQLTALGRRIQGTRLPGEWLPHFDAALAALGWPGERQLSSHEFQTANAFRALQQELYTLGSVTGRMSYDAALALLQRLAGETIFQPETLPAPLEILGVLEAAGSEFDRLWVAGLHDEAWPPPAHANGFLPVVLQRRYRMPHASAERELEYATRVTGRLIASAGDVILSSPQRDGDRMLRPSPLICPFEPVAALEVDDAPLMIERVYRSRALERLADDPAPALGSAERARGGARLLAHQAACPFRAFAEHRLHADELETPAAGIDARTRGAFLHRALEHLWCTLGGSDDLLALTAEERLSVIMRAVRAAADEKLEPYSSGLLDLEIDRARDLIGRLLDIEARRPMFRVEPPEALQIVRIGGKELRLRIDRVDRLAGGARLIIDYKTGQANPNGWWGERPDDPQLPLYAIADGQATSGVSFAILRREGVAFVGLAREEGLAEGIAVFDAKKHGEGAYPDWDALLTGWRATLERLAADFSAGRAAVDPKRRFSTCSYCHLHGLCRVEELKAAEHNDRAA